MLGKSFPGGSVVENSPAHTRNTGSIPGSGRSPGEGNGNPPQYYCLENPKDRRAWMATVHGILQSRILKWVPISFSRGSSWPSDQTQVSFIAGGSLPVSHKGNTLYIVTLSLFLNHLMSQDYFRSVNSKEWDSASWGHSRNPEWEKLYNCKPGAYSYHGVPNSSHP